ncbi:tripartite tricarboxylate transporter substrate binding protein [Cupriavidus basilensis]|uniref:Tripartite tricarboxylate transporter substrate binding protein n=1 Tax=Cupriavidus basilensis TaxID=68895 RepID=A0ABT6AQ20_9BURK|nr:tripartite tricarboxylate transporter substrate binding protein [Cupriavidus basilensis]MDF3834387.1 tripartite tricarboxylate transporter substrate binding protein [Cupriavidus basilensis]
MHSTPDFRRRRLSVLLAACSLAGMVGALAPVAARAEAAPWPNRPIEMIVAYAPGGGTDLIARLLARHLEKELGATIVVQNKPGAGGAIGFAELARAAPDGYTVGFINTPNLLTIPIERKTTFTWKSYDLIGNLVDDPGAFTVSQSSNIDSLATLVKYAKANPGAVTVGTTGVGSDDHLAMLLFEKASGVKMTHVGYKGAGEVRGALTGQQITIGAINVGEALAYQKGGTPLKFLGQMGAARAVLAPNVSTFREQGYNIELASLRGLAAPKGLPEPVRKKLVAALAKVVADPQFKQQADAMFAPLRYLDPAAYAAELERGEAGFRQLWKEMPWQEK